MSNEWYDTAQICIEGHPINCMSVSATEHYRKFCRKCGAKAITSCQNCSAPIKGLCHGPWAIRPSNLSWFTPRSFCDNCGKPYPWTEAKLKAAQELSDELDNLSLEEREILKKSLDDIVRDTPQTTVAATRFKRLVTKAGKAAADGFRDILVDIASETAKKLIWP
ncbi:DUF2321 domain-containing protein [Chloroflexota bacterium]